MMINKIYNDIHNNIFNSAYDNIVELNKEIMNILNKDNLSEEENNLLEKAITIGNCFYTNSDSDFLPIEDGIYDLMVEKFRKINGKYPVGYKDINIKSPININKSINDNSKLFSYIDNSIIDKMLFKEDIILPNYHLGADRHIKSLFSYYDNYKIPKRIVNTNHNHPTLVGTFNKCKFVLESSAKEKGVYDDSSVSIMERDFFKPLIEKGIINYTDKFTMIATIKYDGISVEADVTDRVISARTRGDAVEGVAADLTPILGGIRFGAISPGLFTNPIGVKFEAIINNYNLNKLNQSKGYDYKNCRTAITGIIGSSDGYLYKDLITLVPLATDYIDDNGEPLDRLVEIEFLNKYYATDELLRYSVITGDYVSVLYQIYTFVKEAEQARSYLPFMYDGVVFEFYDKDIREKLGRENAIDNYKCAIKFNPLVKQTIFTGYYFTIGQDGTITPMICYQPVEFFGTIHPNSSGHSYSNFVKLDLHVGDIIDVTYRNDVITYVTKPDNSHNRENSKNPHNELDSFPEYCPSCGTKIVISDSNKSAKCPNFNCTERSIQRMTSTLEKLGVINFGLESVRTLDILNLSDYIINIVNNDKEAFNILGPNNSINLFNQIKNIMESNIYDYKLFGALGFNNIGSKTWKLIFQVFDYKEFFNLLKENKLNKDNFPKIKNIGPNTIGTILEEYQYFARDIDTILYYFTNIISFKNNSNKSIQIVFTGFRDSELEKYLETVGYECSNSLTKSTDILITPYKNYTQGSKYKKALKYNTKILSIDEFKNQLNI